MELDLDLAINMSTPRPPPRIPRACDRCRKSKIRCNGQSPCDRCIGLPVVCEYLHEPRRRGRAKLRRSATVESVSDHWIVSENASSLLALDGTRTGTEVFEQPTAVGEHSAADDPEPIQFNSNGHQPSIVDGDSSTDWVMATTSSLDLNISNIGELDIWGELDEGVHVFQDSQSSADQTLDFAPAGLPPWNDLIMPKDFRPQESGNCASMDILSFPIAHVDAVRSEAIGGGGFSYHAQSYHNEPHSGPHPVVISAPTVLGQSINYAQHPAIPNLELRYPVLSPLLKYISKFMDGHLACNLLDYYFIDTTNSNFLVKPHSPYVLSHLFRKQTFLDPQYPRPTSPALLCAVLYCSLKTIDIADLELTTNSKASISKGLWETCLRLLGPCAPDAVRNGGETHLRMSDEMASGQPYESEDIVEEDSSKRDLDTFIAILHIGTVVAASNFKGDSTVWWQQALTLAFELGLDSDFSPPEILVHSRDRRSVRMAKETKEERCRAWWLFYIIDRHIALSLNRQLLINQNAGDGLQLPMEDSVWQGSGFAFIGDAQRLYAPSYQMTGIGLFGYFLPLMRILGDIINYHHSEPQYESPQQQPALKEHLAGVLARYEQSAYDLFELLDQSVHPIQIYTDANTHTDTHLMPRIVFYYCIHLIHVLYILLYGKWDPIVMLESSGDWLTSAEFIVCAQHAVAAAKTVSQILALDPELNFIPYLWGIYLLQGSFMLLVFAESMKSGERASPQTIADCETIVHAHEVCVATLSTEYQRNFRRVLRWALQTMQGEQTRDIAQQRDKIRRSLMVYRWNREGKGLGL